MFIQRKSHLDTSKEKRQEKKEYLKTLQKSKKNICKAVKENVNLFDFRSYSITIRELIRGQLDYFKEGNLVMSGNSVLKTIIPELEYADQLFTTLIDYDINGCDDGNTYNAAKNKAYAYLSEHIDNWWD